MRKIKQSKRLVHRPGWQTGINVQQSVSGVWSSCQLCAVGTTMSWAQRGLQAWPERTGQLAKLRHGQSEWRQGSGNAKRRVNISEQRTRTKEGAVIWCGVSFTDRCEIWATVHSLHKEYGAGDPRWTRGVQLLTSWCLRFSDGTDLEVCSANNHLSTGTWPGLGEPCTCMCVVKEGLFEEMPLSPALTHA